MKDKTFTLFLKSLSHRKRSENDLSDVVCATCHASQLFKKHFVNFFFPEIEDAEQLDIEREITESGQRVDFSFEHEGQRYIIENKIYDRNHHFGYYDTAYKVEPSHFGYIVNYHSIIHEGKTKADLLKIGYRIKTWEEFYKYLADTENQDEMFTPIATYIKSVCSIILTKEKMNFNALNTLPTFLKMLNAIFDNASNERYDSEYYSNNGKQETFWGGNSADAHDNCIVGRYFEVKFHNVRGRYNTTWGWMGIYFNDPEVNPTIRIGIREDKNWSGKAYKLLEQKINGNKSEEHRGWYIESGCVWRDLPEDKYDQLHKCETLEEQEQILSDFYKKSIDIIANLIDGTHA